MFKKITIITTLTLLVLLGVSATAQAGATMGMGAKFAWDNYKTAILDYGSSEATPAMRSIDYSSPRFGGNFQLGLLERRLVLAIDMDMGIFSNTIYPLTSATAGTDYETKVKFVKFQIGVEAKFHILQPETHKATPYLFLGLGKAFGKASADDLYNPATQQQVDDWNAQLKMYSKLASPFYFQLGVGAEFFAADAFSVGADIFGFRMEIAKADVGYSTDPAFSGVQKYVNFYMYSSLNVNFSFGGAAAKAEASEEA
ncbi:MAG: hypothetical protein JXR91_02775, partial [Deltaproteobacteria bacterium]|nr:hypothetical protein [Deltaproteobacteria bacterium]